MALTLVSQDYHCPCRQHILWTRKVLDQADLSPVNNGYHLTVVTANHWQTPLPDSSLDVLTHFPNIIGLLRLKCNVHH